MNDKELFEQDLKDEQEKLAQGSSSPKQDFDFSKLSFKEASDELEQCVRALESRNLELEAALSYYQKGSALLKELKARLSSAEQEVEMLLEESKQEDANFDTVSDPSGELV